MQRAFDLVTRFPSPLLIIRQPIVSSWESLMDPIQCRSGLYTLLTDCLLPVSLVWAKKWRWGSDRQLPRFCPPLFVSFHPLPFDVLLYTYVFSSIYLSPSFLPYFACCSVAVLTVYILALVFTLTVSQLIESRLDRFQLTTLTLQPPTVPLHSLQSHDMNLTLQAGSLRYHLLHVSRIW